MSAFSQGFNTSQNFFNSLAARKAGTRQMDMAEEETQFARRQNTVNEARGEFQEAAKQASVLLQKGGPQTRQKAVQMLETLKKGAAEREQLLGLNPGTLTTVVDMAGLTPTAKEISEQQGAAEGAGKVAGAKEVADAAGVPVKEALGFQEKAADADSRLADSLRAAGVDEMTALAAAHGLIDVKHDSNSGEVLITNKVNGTVKRVGVVKPEAAEGEGAVPSTPAPVDRESVMAAVPEAVGVENVLSEMASKVPLLGTLLTDENTTRARQKFRTFNENVISGIVKNPKFPVAEQNRIKKLLPSEGIFENPERAAIAYDEVRKVLENVIETDNKKLETRKLTKSQSGELAQRIETVRSLLTQLGTIDDFKLSKIPQGAISDLRGNPSLRDQFDAKYGEGLAARLLGE